MASTPLIHDSVRQRARLAAVASTVVDVSVIIVSWNSAEWLTRCLDAVQGATGSAAVEVIVFDNQSGDESASRVEERRERGLRLIRSDANVGFAGGVNRGIAAARGRYVLLLNPDCELSRGALDALVTYLEQNPNVAAAVPLLLGVDGQPQREFQLRRFPTITSIAAELLMLDELLPRNVASSRYRYRELELDRPQFIEQPAGAAMMIRRSAFERVGHFDERFAPAWFEDVDYCRRLSAMNEQIALVPAATAVHHGGSSLEHMTFEQFTTIWYRNLYRYAAKWFRAREVEGLRWLIVMGMALRIGALSVGFGKPQATRRTAIRAYVKVMRQAFERWSDTSRSS